MKKLSYDEVLRRCLSNGYKVLTDSSEYVNTGTPVRYECLNCGNTSKTSPRNLYSAMDGYCRKCKPTHGVKFNENEKAEIIRLYKEEGWFVNDIAEKFEVSWDVIDYRLEKWDIKKRSLSEVSKKIRNRDGPTKGFTGMTHSKKSIDSIKESVKQSYAQGNNKIAGGSCTFYETEIGKVQGSYELVFLYKNRNTEISIPSGIKTPMGTYFPDFKIGKTYYEVKSPFTLKVCKGLIRGRSGNLDDTQWKKILWIKENGIDLKVRVFESNEIKKVINKAKEELVI